LAVAFNPFAPEVRANPYPHYAWLRREAPVYHFEPFDLWVLSRYEDVAAVLKAPDLYSSTALRKFLVGGALMGGEDSLPAAARWLLEPEILIATDPPTHTRLRNLVNRGFTPRRIAALEPRVRQITRNLLGEIEAEIESGTEFDLVRSLSMPLPVTVIAEMLGVESERREDFKRWSDALITGLSGSPGTDRAGALASAAQEFGDYFREVIERRRREPTDDLIGVLVKAEEDRRALSATDVLGFCVLLLVAGNETTTNLIGNAVLALLAHPQELSKVRSDPTLVPKLVEETVRYDSPVQALVRTPNQEVEIRGQRIPKEAVMMISFASANRDESHFADPDRFDITRDTRGHLGFGHGVHFCLGASLARLEAKVVLSELLDRFSHLERAEPDEEIEWIDSMLLRGPRALRLRAK